jgi:arsenate reductase
MREMVFYWLPHCSTCQKARRFLENAEGEKTIILRNLKDGLSQNEILDLAEKLGGPKNLFSKRALKYRELKLNEREVSEAEMLDLMKSEYTFIKRPVLVSAGKAFAGFSEKSYASFLAQ